MKTTLSSTLLHNFSKAIAYEWLETNGLGGWAGSSVVGAHTRRYHELIDTLLEKNITPWVTLYHWDLPLALEMQHDGWLNPNIADWFANYAAVCFEHFGDRVKHWITLNEPWCAAVLGYGLGVHG